METRIAKIISYLFHPIVMPLAGMFLVFNLNTYIGVVVNAEARQTIYIILGINTLAVPGFIVLYLNKKKMISGLQMNLRQERWFPFIITAFFFYFTYYLIRQIPLPQIVYSIMLGAVIMMALVLLLNVRWKISIHLLGIGGLTGSVFCISQKLLVNMLPEILVLVVIAGIIGFARLQLKSHRAAEIYSAAVIGFLCEYAAISMELG